MKLFCGSGNWVRTRNCAVICALFASPADADGYRGSGAVAGVCERSEPDASAVGGAAEGDCDTSYASDSVTSCPLVFAIGSSQSGATDQCQSLLRGDEPNAPGLQLVEDLASLLLVERLDGVFD